MTTMQPKESAEFIARLSTHVKVVPAGIERVAAEVNFSIWPLNE